MGERARRLRVTLERVFLLLPSIRAGINGNGVNERVGFV
jgi:hypothetical protein